MPVTLSTATLPTIDRAGRFPLLNPVFEFTYRNPTHALHLYDYSGRIRIGSKEYAINPGDMTCIQSGTVYSLATESPGKHWCIHYNDAPVAGTSTMELPDFVHLGVNSLFYLEQIRLISRLHYSPGQRDPDDPVQLEARFRLKALLLALHNLSVRQPSGRRSRRRVSWDALLAWVEENLHCPLSVPRLAERVDLAPGTFTRRFKEAHQMTLSQYLLHRRIDKAKSLLATTTLTVYEVGSAVGIPDPQYFNKQFRKIAGISPSSYRDDNQEYLTNVPDGLAVQEGQWQSDPPP